MTLLMYAGMLAAGAWGLRAMMRGRASARAMNAVGKDVALITPREQADGTVELQFIVGEFQLIDTNFYLRLESQEAFIVPGPLLVKLKSNPAPELFEGAPYVLRLSDEEARQLQILAGTEQNPGAPVN